jgi:hypothetical protein
VAGPTTEAEAGKFGVGANVGEKCGEDSLGMTGVR